ncbi:hypothetical protein KR038_008185 [Drosophila bunnanda]|nr:hypothetical protein KR038_008185 [Drosophila bunnanda]
MASKVEQQYKLLNAELMDQVQKQRIEIGLYKKELIALKHENMELREARVLQIARQRQDHIGIIKSLMRRLEIDAKCLANITQTPEEESISSEASFVVNRQSQKRRSSRELCQEMRQSSALACSSRTISPARRRDTIPEERNEASKLTVEYRARHTPPPRRVAEIAIDSSSEEDEEQANTSVAQDEENPIKEQPPRKSGDDLCTIIEDSDEETTLSSSTYSSSPISCDSTIEEFTLPRQVLRSLDPNVVASGGMLTRGKSKPTKSLALDKDNSIEEQSSIQLPRLLVTEPSPTLVDSLISSPSYASNASKLSPRRSMFEGNFRLSGTNTSTPIPIRSSTQENMAAKKTSEVPARTSRCQPKVKVRNLKSEPKEAEQTTDLSTTCFSSSGRRPSRKCKPTQLSEPNLRVKMRNTSVGKKIN